MTTQTRAEDLATAIGADFKASMVDRNFLSRLDRETDELLRFNSNRMEAAVGEAKTFSEQWLDLRNWTGTGTVVSGRVYSSAGIQRAVPTSPRWVARATLHSTGVAGKYAYFGIADGTNYLSIGQTSASSTAFINRSAGISAAAVVAPRTMPALAAGDYLCTIAKDETHYSMTIQPAGTTGQLVYGLRVKISDLPAPITTFLLSANDTAAGGLNWGPMVVHEELAVPPLAQRTVNGVSLFGAGKPLAFWRSDPTTNFGHMVHIPGDNDPRIPAPVCMFLHQSLSGLASNIYTEARMGNVLSALESAGYIVCSSDNGPSATSPGGTQDRFGNQIGLDDYAALATWVRGHQNTGALCLFAPSMGNFMAMGLLNQRILGGITAVAGISTGFDLYSGLSNPTYRQPLLDAYGAVDDADFLNKTALYDPARQPPWRFRGVPWKMYAGDADTTAPPATQTQVWATRIAPYSPESTVVIVPGAGHLADTLYQGSDVVAFFNRYSGHDNGGAVTSGPTEKRQLKNQGAVVLKSGTETVERYEIVSDGTANSGWPNRRELLCTPVAGGAPRIVQYDNEYFERRFNARQNTVLWRAFVREYMADPAHDMAVPIWEIQDDRDNRVQKHGFYGQGNFYHSGDGTVAGALVVSGAVTAPNIGVKVTGVYNAGSEPAGQPTGTVILVRP